MKKVQEKNQFYLDKYVRGSGKIYRFRFVTSPFLIFAAAASELIVIDPSMLMSTDTEERFLMYTYILICICFCCVDWHFH